MNEPWDTPLDPEAPETPRKRRKRASVEEVDVTEPIKKQAEKNRKEKAPSQIGVMCDMALLGAFRCAALATDHPHWNKTQEQVRVATEPLQAMIERLPKAVVKEMEGKALPILFVIGCGMLVIPDVIREMEIRRYERFVAAQALHGQAGHRNPGAGAAGPQAAHVPGSNGGGPGFPEQLVEPLVTADPRTPGLDTGAIYP